MAERATSGESEEWDALVADLAAYGVDHLWQNRAPANEPRSAEALFAALFESSSPRLHQASAALLLVRPDLAPAAQRAILGLPALPRDRAMRRYMAAAYLQRIARSRLRSLFGDQPELPTTYAAELNLPDAEARFGEHALEVLSDEESRRYGYDAWGTYWRLLETVLRQAELSQAHVRRAASTVSRYEVPGRARGAA